MTRFSGTVVGPQDQEHYLDEDQKTRPAVAAKHALHKISVQDAEQMFEPSTGHRVRRDVFTGSLRGRTDPAAVAKAMRNERLDAKVLTCFRYPRSLDLVVAKPGCRTTNAQSSAEKFEVEVRSKRHDLMRTWSMDSGIHGPQSSLQVFAQMKTNPTPVQHPLSVTDTLDN